MAVPPEIRLCLLAGILSPAAGGLSVSVPALAHRLSNIDNVNVRVVGVEDRDDPAAAGDWAPDVSAQRSIAAGRFQLAPGIDRALQRFGPDVTDVQGLWTYPSLANLRHHRRTGTPFVVTPRGMLDPWALQRSSVRKRAVRFLFEDAHLARAACLRATADMEAGHFRDFGLRQPIAVVPNGIDTPDPTPSKRPPAQKQLLFLSRIHPKKGLPILLDSWAQIAADRPDWTLVIAGPDEVGHEADMKQLARELRLPRVTWAGPLFGAEKDRAYRDASVFVLPTHAENFGLVVAEALARGTPVITTRNAPWSGLADHRCGWWIDLSQQALVAALLDATAKPSGELDAMGARGRAWMERDFAWDRIADQMLEVYHWVLSGSSRPPSMVRLD